VILLLWQQNEALEQVSRGFREYSRSQSPFMIGVVALLAAGVVASLVYAFLSGRVRTVGERLFRRLARANGLDRSETELLESVSRRVLPDNPPEIFVRRSLFESALPAMNLNPELAQSVRKKVYGP
jgi:hypothetical protein